MPVTEIRWSCGCQEVDGQLVAECTQIAPSGDVSAEKHAQSKPYARKCGRKAAEEDRARIAQAIAQAEAVNQHQAPAPQPQHAPQNEQVNFNPTMAARDDSQS
jgi:hypothetical protein